MNRFIKAFGAGLAVLALLGALLPTGARAQAAPDYPQRAVTIIVPHPPGGSVDNLARMFAVKLGEVLGQSVVIENRPGASGLVGAGVVARATPDGYTLYLNASIHSINPLLYQNRMQFDAVADFTAISGLARGALIFSINPQVPAHSVEEFVRLVKAEPAAFNFSTSGIGSAGHLAMAQFMFEAGLDKLDIPVILYNGGGPVLTALVGGQVQALIDPMLSALPMVQAGKTRALAVTGATRSALLPDTPTMMEAGLAGFEFYSWYGLWAPARLPETIRATLDAAARTIMTSAEMRSQLARLGFETMYRDSADFGRYIDSEVARYRSIIEQAGIRIEN